MIIGAVLLLKTFLHLWQIHPGFRPQHVLTMQITLSPKEYPRPPQQAAFWKRVLQAVDRLPGVRSAGLVSVLPTTGSHSNTGVRVKGRNGPLLEPVMVHVQAASSRYFATMGIPLKQGRFFEERDDSGGPLVTVIDQTMARTFWPGQDAIGQSVVLFRKSWRVVGVVGDVRQDGLDKANRCGMYVHYLQDVDSSTRMSLAVATEPAPLSLVQAVQHAVRRVDPGQPVSGIRTMETVLSDGLRIPRLLLLLLGFLAGMILVLALLGVYGLLSCSVARCRREIGLRMALGARPVDVRRMIFRQGILLILPGEAAGILMALAATRFLSGQLHGVTPTDPFTFAVVSLALLATAVAACIIPARKATRIDPLVALKWQ
jgi:predicted permease